ncbi:unnamed protein product [Heterosigma akashiwo]
MGGHFTFVKGTLQRPQLDANGEADYFDAKVQDFELVQPEFIF